MLALLVYWRTVKESSGQARKGMAVREYSDGDFIYRAGDAAIGVYRFRTSQVRTPLPPGLPPSIFQPEPVSGGFVPAFRAASGPGGK